MQLTQPSVKFKGGGSFVSKQPKFSTDGETLFVAWNNVILSYNTKTGKRLREYRGLWDSIAGFDVTNIDGVEYLIACSTTAEVISWKVEIGLRMLKIIIPLRNSVVGSFDLLQDNKFLISYTVDRTIFFAVFNILSRKFDEVNVTLKMGAYKVAVGRCERPYFVISEKKSFYFVRLDNLMRPFKHFYNKSKKLTCIACHPEEECIIAGDDLGRVLLWYNLGHSHTLNPSVYHWHTLPVKCLAFSSSGGSFFSGGSENVLVKWNNDDPHRKNFLPRLPANIEHISVSCDNLYIAVATWDNAVRILDARLDTVTVIQHLVLGSGFEAGIVYDGRSKSMLLNGLTGHVQFFSPHDMTLLYNLDVVGKNKLTQERNVQIENTVVTNIAIDDQGLWLATAEERADQKFTPELRLKFWSFNTVKQQYEANTHIESPHERSIVHLLFQPNTNEAKCVSISSDKNFKIWHCINADTIYHKGSAWRSLYTGTYRELPCTALAFSHDGSLLGIGFGPIITMWEPDTCKLKCSLVHPAHRNNLKAMHFGISSQCHLIVAATAEDLSVWNLLTLSMVWTVPLKVVHLVASSTFSSMAVFTQSNKVYVFSPESSNPLFIHALPPEMGQIIAAALVPAVTSRDSKAHWFKATQLFFINSKEELFCFETDEDNIDSFDSLVEDLHSGLFKSMVPKKKSSAQKSKPVTHLTKLSSNNKEVLKLLNAPVHTMTPQRLTCETLLRSIVLEHK